MRALSFVIRSVPSVTANIESLGLWSSDGAAAMFVLVIMIFVSVTKHTVIIGA